MADANVRRTLNVSMGFTRPTLAVYPALDPAAPWGAPMFGGAGAYGAWVDIIGNTLPAIATEFWLLKLIIGVNDTINLYEFQINNLTTATLVYECRADPAANVVSMPPFDIPIPVWCAPNDNIQGHCGDAGGGKIFVSLLVATGL